MSYQHSIVVELVNLIEMNIQHDLDRKVIGFVWLFEMALAKNVSALYGNENSDVYQK